MSRIGRKPIPVPAGVKIAQSGATVKVEGPKGKMSLEVPDGVSVQVSPKEVSLARRSDESKFRSLHGTTRALLANMVYGVSQGFSRKLELVGVGLRAQVAGSKITFSLGFSHPVVFELPDGVSAKVDEQTKLTLSGIDKEKLGLVSAQIRMLKPPEPYKGKGIRYENEVIKKKAGKAASGGK